MRLTDLEDLPMWEWPDEAVDLILDGLSSDDADDRELAVELAAEVGADERVVTSLLAIVESEADPELRGMAAIALGPTLESCDLDEEDAISKDTFERACGVLEAAWADERNPELVRRRALEAAVRAPRKWQKAAIRTALATEGLWRVTGVFCAARYPSLGELALAALDDPDPDVRLQAVAAIGTVGARDEIGRLLRILESDHSSRELCLTAIESCAELGSKQATPALTELLDSDDEEIAEAAEEALMLLELAGDLELD